MMVKCVVKKMPQNGSVCEHQNLECARLIIVKCEEGGGGQNRMIKGMQCYEYCLHFIIVAL